MNGLESVSTEKWKIFANPANPKELRTWTQVVVAIRDGGEGTGASKIWGTESYNSFLLSYNMTEYSEP